jgi:hypothetical protein
MKAALSNPNVQLLAEMFDLKVPKMYNILIDVYSVSNNELMIKHAVVLDAEFQPMREANLGRLAKHLHECNIVFKKL